MLHSRLAALGGAAAAAAALAAAPAAAQGATITAPACVGGLATGLSAPLQGTGFTPNAPVRIAANGATFATATADAAGNFGVTPAPPLISGNHIQQTFQLTASDGTNGAGPTPLRVTRWFAKLPSRARADHKVKFRAYGFIPGKRVYVFVRRHGHTLGRFSLGKAKGPCGNASRRLRYMPLRHHSTGTYRYFFEQSRKFSTKKPRIRLTIIITRVLR